MIQQPLFRSTDPQTSADAAMRAQSFRVHHEGLIFGAIHDAGERGATAKEIAKVTGLTDVQVNRRLGNMGERKLICRREIEPFRFESRSGCAVWRVA